MPQGLSMATAMPETIQRATSDTGWEICSRASRSACCRIRSASSSPLTSPPVSANAAAIDIHRWGSLAAGGGAA